MANAFLLAPMRISDFRVDGSLTMGDPSYLANDYVGVVCRVQCDNPGNGAALRFDLGSNQSVDTFMLFGLTDFPAEGTVIISYAVSAAPETFIAVATQPPYAGGPRTDGLGVLLCLAAAPVTARWIQFTFLAPSSGFAVKCSRAVIGTRFQPAIGFEYGAEFGVKDLGSLDVNARGVLLRHRGKKLRTLSLNFPSLSREEAESKAQKMLEQLGNSECVALCTNTAPEFERMNRCYYGPLIGDLGRTWVSARGHEVRINLLGLM